MDTKLQQATDLQKKLTATLAASEKQIEAAKAQLGAALALQALSMPGTTTAENAQRRVDELVAKQERDRLQLQGLETVIQQIQPGSSSAVNTRGTPDRHAKIQEAQKTYNRLWSQLNRRSGDTSDPHITPEVREAFDQLLEAGKILRNTAKIASLVETWGLIPERDVYGGCTGIADSSGQKYGDWNPPAPVKPAPWVVIPFASFAKRLKLSEKGLRDLFIRYQQSIGDTLIPWQLQTRSQFDALQNWIEDNDLDPKPSFHPPAQANLAKDLDISERTLRNRFTAFRQKHNDVANGYTHLSSSQYQAFRQFLNDPVVESAVIR